MKFSSLVLGFLSAAATSPTATAALEALRGSTVSSTADDLEAAAASSTTQRILVPPGQNPITGGANVAIALSDQFCDLTGLSIPPNLIANGDIPSTYYATNLAGTNLQVVYEEVLRFDFNMTVLMDDMIAGDTFQAAVGTPAPTAALVLPEPVWSAETCDGVTDTAITSLRAQALFESQMVFAYSNAYSCTVNGAVREVYNCDIEAVQLSSNSFLARCQAFSNSAAPSLRYCPTSLTTSLNPILYPASTTMFTNTSFEDLLLLDGQEQRRLEDAAASAPPVSATESSVPTCSCEPPETSTFLEIYNAAINDQFNLDNTTAFVTGVVQLCPCDTKNQLCPAGTDDTCNINARKKTRDLQGSDVTNDNQPLFYNETCYCFDEDATVTQKSPRPTRRPTKKPTRRPTKRPTRRPTKRPTKRPSKRPTKRPSKRPTKRPSKRPTTGPSASGPTSPPTTPPTSPPSPSGPTTAPVTTGPPTTPPTNPVIGPTNAPVIDPTSAPVDPTSAPVDDPTEAPVIAPVSEQPNSRRELNTKTTDTQAIIII